VVNSVIKNYFAFENEWICLPASLGAHVE